MTDSKSLKQMLNSIYGAYNLPMVEIKDEIVTEEENMINAYPVKNYTINFGDDVLTKDAVMTQQEVYKAIMSRPSMTIGEDKQKDRPWDTPEEKWTWVTGYKGLDKDMKAYGDFQYEMDKLYIMPEGEPVEACHGGFHLCLKLEDLHNYKSIGAGNRFFECKALVRESDLKKYGTHDIQRLFTCKVDKLAAKSIQLTRELSVDEILAHIDGVDEWPFYVKKTAITENIDKAKTEMKILTMIKMGYAEPLAKYIVNDRNGEDGYNLAVALDSQPGISMDTKINAIFSHI